MVRLISTNCIGTEVKTRKDGDTEPFITTMILRKVKISLRMAHFDWSIAEYARNVLYSRPGEDVYSGRTNRTAVEGSKAAPSRGNEMSLRPGS